jgi:hypothetical protein
MRAIGAWAAAVLAGFCATMFGIGVVLTILELL